MIMKFDAVVLILYQLETIAVAAVVALIICVVGIIVVHDALEHYRNCKSLQKYKPLNDLLFYVVCQLPELFRMRIFSRAI